ncbi:hypothetical protein [Streptomyces sp. NPDC003877]
MAIVTRRHESMQYDGTNGTAVAEWLDGAYTISSDTGVQLMLLSSEGSRKVIPATGWLVRDASHELVWYGTGASYAVQWTDVEAG